MPNDAPALHLFQSSRLTISYAAWGDPANPTLILVHGGLDQKRSWDWTAEKFADRYYVVAPDLRGHGMSEWTSDGDYGVMDHVYDLASLVDHLDAETVTLVGHSLGGNIALRYAGLFPARVKKLVAIEGMGPSPKMLAERTAMPVEERLQQWIKDRRKKSDRSPRLMADMDEAYGRMRAAHGHLREDQLRHLTETGVKKLERGKISWAYDPAAMGRSPSDIRYKHFQKLLSNITCPIWLVYGETSWASNPEKDGRAEIFQNAKTTEIIDAGHWLHHDKFDEFIVGLTSFLEQGS
ncbi:MAG: alpha/beta hydrolase [Marinicaulis sp.]|nr:alpha/beta hydrolase [Marinicaulis sp.]NNE40746.1 alpha/beta hydrolase [Marinicaulis sp.]NNL89300.1 alpha/beta hydrolase [Marinicaulis sp.]